ncbi:glycosyltransferase [Psychrobacter celer]|uniref:glycosyltransferase n=1 Tax=Psychrobacter celer TaxID=306572 RepID=UPI003FD145E3
MGVNFFFVSPTAVLGGAERTMFNLITYLLEDGHKVTMFIMSRGEQVGWESIIAHPNFEMIIKNYKSEKTSLPVFFFNIFYLSHINSYDYSFSSHTHVNGALSLMRRLKLFKTKHLISRESTFIFERYQGAFRTLLKAIYKFMYGSQDLVICQTERMKTSLIQNLGFMPAKKIEVISNPVNLSYVTKQMTQNDSDEKSFEQLIVGCGRLITLKKFNWLIRAFSDIAEEFPHAGVVIIGDGPERENLTNLVKDLGIEDKVIFTGKISNPIKWFGKADIGVISSEIEGFPNVLIEMMASGTKQVITTPCTDGVNNMPYITVTESCSREAIQKSLIEQLRNPVDNSTNHRKYIEGNRSVEVFWRKVQEHLV